LGWPVPSMIRMMRFNTTSVAPLLFLCCSNTGSLAPKTCMYSTVIQVLPPSVQFTLIIRMIRPVHCTVYGTLQCQAGTASAEMISERPLYPRTSHFCPPACSFHVLPHNASMNNPEAGLGLHQLGGGPQRRLAWKVKTITAFHLAYTL
jgi:hypothetical protein